MCWCSIYTGLSNSFRVDEGMQFQKIFAELSAMHDIQVKQRGMQ